MSGERYISDIVGFSANPEPVSEFSVWNLVALIAAVSAALVILLLVLNNIRLRRLKRKKDNEKNRSVSYFKDKLGTVIALPVLENSVGVRKHGSPYYYTNAKDVATLGGIAIKLCKLTKREQILPPDAKDGIYAATGIDNYYQFAKDRLLVVCQYTKDKGYVISNWARTSDGKFLDGGRRSDSDEHLKKYTLPDDTDATEIGMVIAHCFLLGEEYVKQRGLQS